MRLIWFCVICFAGAFVAGTFVPAAFTDSPAYRETGGSIQVLLATTAAESHTKSPFDSAGPIFIEADYFDVGASHYDLSFPKKLSGKRFAVVTDGSGVLIDPSFYYREDVYIPDIRTFECGSWLDERGRRIHETCQVIYGTVPYGSGDPEEDLEGLSGGWCSKIEKRSEYISLVLFGDTSASYKPDWAHWSNTLPGFGGGDANEHHFVRSHDGEFKLDSNYGSVPHKSCKQLTLWRDRKVGDTDVPPTRTDWDRLIWDGASGDGQVTAITVERNAEGLGNLLLASAAALAALSIGFIPVAYEEYGRWRQYRKSLRSPLIDNPTA
jgi:hypothetical protein